MPSIFGVFAKGLILVAQCRGFSGTKSAFRGFTSLFDTWRFHHFTIKCFFTVNGFWNKNEVIIKMGRGHASLQNAQSLLIGPMNTHEDQTLGENGKTARQNIEGKTASKRQNCLASCHVTQPEKKGEFRDTHAEGPSPKEKPSPHLAVTRKLPLGDERNLNKLK